MRPNVTDLKLDYPELKEEFKAHLSDPLNSRILFTAPFGSGKSTFLYDFFESDGAQDTLPSSYIRFTMRWQPMKMSLS